MSVQSFALASIMSAYTDSYCFTDSEDENNFIQDYHQDRSPIHAVIPESVQKSNSSSPEQLSNKEDLLDTETDEDDVKIPPTPAGSYPIELQERFNNFVKLSEASGLDFNSFMQNRKSFSNPSIYEKLVLHCGLNEYGTNFSPGVYDPFKWGKESFYDQLGIVQQESMNKLQKPKKETVKFEIVSGVAKHPSPKEILNNKNNNNVKKCTNNNNNSSAAVSTSKNHTGRKTKCEFTSINFNFKRPRH